MGGQISVINNHYLVPILNNIFGSFFEKYQPSFNNLDVVENNIIGYGRNGNIYKYKNVITGKDVAVKFLPLTKGLNDLEFMMKCASINPEFVVEVKEFFIEFQDTEVVLILVMEYIEGGDLFCKISNSSKVPPSILSETETKNIINQTARFLEGLHRNNINYGDLKAENILIKDGLIKVVDFEAPQPNSGILNMTGSPSYFSPSEAKILLTRKYMFYDKKSSDMWALGILMYFLLFGVYPFKGLVYRTLFMNICNVNIIIPNEPNVSPDANYIITNLLKKDPNHRMTAAQLLNSNWIKNI